MLITSLTAPTALVVSFSGFQISMIPMVAPAEITEKQMVAAIIRISRSVVDRRPSHWPAMRTANRSRGRRRCAIGAGCGRRGR